MRASKNVRSESIFLAKCPHLPMHEEELSLRTFLNKLAYERFCDSLYHNGDLVAARGLPRRFLDQL
jgi:hypothetical protein